MAEGTRHTAKTLEECVGRLNKNDEQMTSITIVLNEVSRRHSAIENKLDKSCQEQQQQNKESQVPIDSCVVGVQHSAFLQQASYITGGIYLKPPQLDGLFQYLAAVFSTDLQSRNFLQLPKPAGVDFRASCFCHKKTIDMGYVCSVCLSIFCQHHKKCSTCGSEFNQVPVAPDSASDTTRKA